VPHQKRPHQEYKEEMAIMAQHASAATLQPLCTFRDVTLHYEQSQQRNTSPATSLQVDDFAILPGTLTAVTGCSGSGKTTIGKAIVGLEQPTGGEIRFKDSLVNTKAQRKKIKYNENVQMVFQDVMSSLDPKKRIRDIIAEPIRNFERITRFIWFNKHFFYNAIFH